MAVYIGPFLKTMHGFNFTNIYKSKYIAETKKLSDSSVLANVSSSRAFDEKRSVLLLDDNIVTGTTMAEIKEQLTIAGINKIVSGAIQYNWRNYYRVSVGEKIGIDRFELDEYDILTPINYAGHNLYKHAIDCLNSSGEDYINYLKSKGYRRDIYPDLMGAMIRTFESTERIGLYLRDKENNEISENCQVDCLIDEYKSTPKKISNPNAQKMVNLLEEAISSLCMESEKFQESDLHTEI